MKCNNNKNFSGIYCIVNTITSQLYIGSGVSVRKRYERHLRTLLNNTHFNSRLQRSFNKYSEDAFTFLILKKCNKEELLKIEQYYIDTLNPYYNLNKIANQMNPLGSKRDPLIGKKISISLTGKKLSVEHKLKLSLAKLGKPSHKKYKGIPVVVYKDDILIGEYLNGTHCADSLFTDRRYVYHCLKHGTKHKKLTFKYLKK